MTPVLVTTEKRGVFFGYLDSDEFPASLPGHIVLKKCRNCIYWSSECHGFIGLAVDGPVGDCRIGPAADEMRIESITSMAKVTTAAAKKWEAGPWS